eukprot:1159068-Pelagomonas_calceolata.AAC.16
MHWLRRAASLLHHKATDLTPNRNKLVGILKRAGMKLTGKLHGTLVVQTQLLKLVKGVLSITRPANAQENGVKSRSFCTHNTRLQSSAHAAGLHFSWCGCPMRLAIVVFCVGLFLLRNTGVSRGKKNQSWVWHGTEVNQDSIRTAGGASRSRRKSTRKEGSEKVMHRKGQATIGVAVGQSTYLAYNLIVR